MKGFEKSYDQRPYGIVKKKYLLLDLGGVLFTRKETCLDQAFWLAVQECNLIYADQLDLGRISFQKYLAEFNRINDCNLTEGEFFQKIESDIEFNHELLELRNAGLEIILVSDNYRENIEYLRKRFLEDIEIRKEYYSYNLGTFKDDKRFFRMVIEDLGANPGEMILLDDSEENIEVAADAGIIPVRFISVAQSVNDVHALLS